MRPAVLSAAGALTLLADPLSSRAQPVPAAVEAPESLILAEVRINGERRDGESLIARRGEYFLVRGEDLDRWRIRRPDVPVVAIDGEGFVPLSALPGLMVTFDTARQRLDLTVPPALFESQRVSAARAGRIRPTDSTFAAFINYDLAFAYDDRVTGSAFVEAGVSDDWGMVASTMTIGKGSTGSGATRLDSYFLRDDPENLTRLVIGDTVTGAHDWSRSIRFGGIRLGTEFGLQPDLVTFPVPGFTERAALPSSVELLVNDTLRFQTNVGQGPFSIDQVPLVTGAGEVTLVVRDPLGVERRVKTPYYVSARLLSRGLSAWSIEAGAERRDYGVKSFSYHNPFAAGSYRYGVSNWLTLEARTELSGNVQMAGAGASLIWPVIGEFGVAAAASRGEDGEGTLWRVFFSRVSQRWSLAASYQRASQGFDQLGIDRDSDRITRQFQLSGGLSLGRWGNVALSYTDLDYADRNRTRLASANYSVGIADKAYLSVFALNSRIEDEEQETTLGAAITIPFGARTSAYVQADSRGALAELRQTPPNEGGWGYRLTAAAGDADRQQAEARWRGDIGEASIEAARFEGDAGLRMLASGGVLFAGGRPHATRRVQDGLGVVEIPGQAGVRIYQENRLVTRTDENGRAVIPDLRPYEANRITLAPSDLPLDVRMPDDVMIVVPRFRGAAQARFAVTRDDPATLIVHLPNGKPVEPGSAVRTDAGERSFAGQGGEIFLRTARHGMVIELDTADGPCRVTLRALPADEILPRIGPLSCTLAGGGK